MKAKDITLIFSLVIIAAIVGVLLYFDKKKGETDDETETKSPLLQAQFLPVDASLTQALRDWWSAMHNTPVDNNDDENNNDAEVDNTVTPYIPFGIAMTAPSPQHNPGQSQPLTTKGNNFDTFVQLSKGHNFFIGR